MKIQTRLMLAGFLISIVASFGGITFRYFSLVREGVDIGIAFLTTSVFIVFGVAIWVIFVLYLVAASISKPIANLTNVVEEITKGNFEVRLRKSSFYEIQNLTNSLERVLASLKLATLKTGAVGEGLGLKGAIKAKEKAEKLVQKRTEQLERFSRLAVKREEKMVELKKQIKQLKKQLESVGKTHSNTKFKKNLKIKNARKK